MKLPLLILASLLIGSLLLEPTMSMTDYCRNRCSMRCARAGMADRCIKYCGLCCEQCKCVPSGTYGNKHECPCYRDKVSSKGRPKCP